MKHLAAIATVAVLALTVGAQADPIPLDDPAIIDHGAEHDSSSWAAEMAIDETDTGDPEYGTAYIAGSGNGLPWIAFDFVEATRITGFDHYQRDWSSKMVRTFDLLFSNSPDFSTMVESVTDIAATQAGLGLTEVRDFDVTARYVKWEATDASDFTGASDLVFYTPEPATMGLLGLGGLVALIRRRR